MKIDDFVNFAEKLFISVEEQIFMELRNAHKGGSWKYAFKEGQAFVEKLFDSLDQHLIIQIINVY